MRCNSSGSAEGSDPEHGANGQTEQTKQDETGQAAKQRGVAKIAKDIAVATGVQTAASRVHTAIQQMHPSYTYTTEHGWC